MRKLPSSRGANVKWAWDRCPSARSLRASSHSRCASSKRPTSPRPSTGSNRRIERQAIMSVRVIQLGTARLPHEGIRIGTVRRPPRGVPRSEFSKQNWYDVWFPNLAPSAEAVKLGLSAASPAQWSRCVKTYRSEMSKPEARHDIELLAALSHTTNFSVGCYCENEARCHRSVLRQLLVESGAKVE